MSRIDALGEVMTQAIRLERPRISPFVVQIEPVEQAAQPKGARKENRAALMMKSLI